MLSPIVSPAGVGGAPSQPQQAYTPGGAPTQPTSQSTDAATGGPSAGTKDPAVIATASSAINPAPSTEEAIDTPRLLETPVPPEDVPLLLDPDKQSALREARVRDAALAVQAQLRTDQLAATLTPPAETRIAGDVSTLRGIEEGGTTPEFDRKS